mgnify:CR=1 FL=1
MCWNICLEGRNHAAVLCPVRVPVPESWEGAPRTVSAPCPFVVGRRAELRRIDGSAFLCFVVRNLPPGRTVSFPIDPEKPADVPPAIRFAADAGTTAVHVGRDLLTRLHWDPDGVRPYLYPLYGPDGCPVTRSFPMRSDVPGEAHDHPHHRSLYTAYGDVNGADVWSESDEHGRQVVDSPPRACDGSVFGSLAFGSEWVDAGNTPLLTDERRITIYNAGDDVRVFDYQLTLRAVHGDAVFADTKEGGLLAIRVAGDLKERSGGRIVNALGGIGEDECWGQAAPWVDYTGTVGRNTVGISVFDHPGNPDYPTRWHVRGYGLFAANPFGLSAYRSGYRNDGTTTIPCGTARTYRYRVLIHRGTPSEAEVPSTFLDFAFPCRATLEVLS